jgi:hypothetical protein
MIWATRFNETIVKEEVNVGGKGGPRTTAETTEYLYDVSFAIGLCEADGEVKLGRIWADGKPMDLRGVTYRFYDGSQVLADPKIESIEGEDLTPAYTGTCYIVFESLPLKNYGNRVPQITVEVIRRLTTAPDTDMEVALQSVNFIPGTGEMVYATRTYFSENGEGDAIAENQNSSSARSDMTTSIEQLRERLPNVDSVSLVVSWFGSSLDATTCTVKPKVDSSTKVFSPQDWTVSGVRRADADVVSSYEGSPAFGGTPSDISIREAIERFKVNNWRVVFYPFLLMDFDGYPWRGELVGDPSNFLGTAQPSDFSPWVSEIMDYTGPDEFTWRRMILSYANLVSDLFEAGDVFLIGSEMRGLTETSTAWATAMNQLITDVKSMLPAGVLVSYASDWSEYDHDNLSTFWPNADFVGIDYYMPLTDWRTSDDENYTLDHFKSGIVSGEYWDYFYASEQDRTDNVRTPITQSQFQQKNIRYWRDNNQPGKEIWFTEFGCGAIDKGGNQPNVFFDPKSTSSGTPWFSDGSRNDAVQRLYIEAMLAYWEEDGLVDPRNMFVWTWDARPYPTFPYKAINLWGDSERWSTGHWINGRLDVFKLSDVVTELAKEAGYAEENINVADLKNNTTLIQGMLVTGVTAYRDTILNLMNCFLFDVYEDGEDLIFVRRVNPESFDLTVDDMIYKNEGETYSIARTRETDLPDRTKITYIDPNRDYNEAAVDGHTVTGTSDRVMQFDALALISNSYARGLADVLTQESWIGRDHLRFTLPFANSETGDVFFGIEPGHEFEIFDRTFRVNHISVSSTDIEIDAKGFESSIYELVAHTLETASVEGTASFGSSLLEFAELPLFVETDPNHWSPRIYARQNPWPGKVDIYRDDGSGGYNLNTSLPLPAQIGVLTEDFPSGKLWVWDDDSELVVRMFNNSANLSSMSDLSVLNGANAVAVLTPSGEWEVLQYANATLNSDGTYTLTRLLRGQLGTEPYMGDPTPSGSRFIIYDTESFGVIQSTIDSLGVPQNLRYGPGTFEVSDERYKDVTVTPQGVAYRPYAPVSLKVEQSGSDLVLSWIRRTRFGGDSWTVLEVPLSEETESYSVDILDDNGDVIRTLTSTTPTLTYGSTDIVSDFGGSRTSVEFNVYQISNVFGRGSAGEFRFDALPDPEPEPEPEDTPTEVILDETPTAFYVVNDLTSLSINTDGTGGQPSIGDLVGRVDDLSGNGYHLVAQSDAARGTLQQDSDGSYYIQSDGSTTFYKPAITLALSSTFSHVGVWKDDGSNNRRPYTPSFNYQNALRAYSDGYRTYDDDGSSIVEVASGDPQTKHVLAEVRGSNSNLTAYIDGTGGMTIDPYDMGATEGLAIFSQRNDIAASGIQGRFYSGAWWQARALSGIVRGQMEVQFTALNGV